MRVNYSVGSDRLTIRTYQACSRRREWSFFSHISLQRARNQVRRIGEYVPSRVLKAKTGPEGGMEELTWRCARRADTCCRLHLHWRWPQWIQHPSCGRWITKQMGRWPTECKEAGDDYCQVFVLLGLTFGLPCAFCGARAQAALRTTHMRWHPRQRSRLLQDTISTGDGRYLSVEWIVIDAQFVTATVVGRHIANPKRIILDQ